jgi:hypothetical protein
MNTLRVSRIKRLIGAGEPCIARHPEIFIAGALVLGVMLGWWIKRR